VKKAGKVLAVCLSATMVMGMSIPAAADSKEELTFWFPPFAGGEGQVSDQTFWEEMFVPFEEENNCEVTVGIVPWEGYEEKYLSGAASPDGPDVGYMYTEMMYEYIAEMNALTDIDGYFTEEEKDNYLYYNLGNVLGGQYALPVIVGNPSILVANMDILNAAGIDAVPTTWDELLAACEAVKNSNPDVYPFLQEWGNSSYGCLGFNYWPYFWSAGGEITDEEGNLTIDSEAGLKATEFIYSLMESGYMPETATSVNSCGDVFRDGRAAMIMVPSGYPLQYTEINWDFSAVLQGPEAAMTYVAQDSLVLFESCENKELAVKLMKYVTSAEVMGEFYSQIIEQMPITKDSTFTGDERYNSLYSDYGDNFLTLPVFKGSATLYDTLLKNLQSMMLGDLTPQEVLTQTTEYYNNSIR
jgi:multiple sugar transport system substrate-binding protein